jgi:hypothetical protein
MFLTLLTVQRCMVFKGFKMDERHIGMDNFPFKFPVAAPAIK